MKTLAHRKGSGAPALALATNLAVALALATPATARSQEATDAEATLVLEEVVVTAKKREQSARDVAMALTVLDEALLSEQRVFGLDDMPSLVPSLDIFRGNGSNNPTITLRGIGTTNPWVNNNPSVATHFDGVYLPMSAYLTFPLFDLERVEVLKGPQVGLYGRNATAGAINFESRRPDQQTSGYVDAFYGNYDLVEVQAAAGGALSDTLSGRIALLYQDGGGYMDRAGTRDSTAGFTRVPGVIPPIPDLPPEDDYGDRDVLALRGSLVYTPTTDLEVFLSVHYANDDSELIGSTNINGDFLGIFEPPTDAAFVDYDNVEPRTDSEQIGGVLEIRRDFGVTELVSVTGVETLERAYAIGDFVPTRIAEASFDEDLQSFFQELRVDYQPTDDFRWLSGATWNQDEIDYFRALSGFDFLLGALGTAYRQDDKAWALWTQAEWQFAPGWELNGSLRYTDEEKVYDGGSFEIDPFGTSIVGLVFPNVVPDGLFARTKYEDDDVSGHAGVTWEPSDASLYYLTVSRAFKSGGFDGSGITEPVSFLPYGPETVWSYELGGKWDLFDRRVYLGASAFFYDYTDKQVLALQDLGSGILEAVIQNAAESEVYGLDLELDWLLTDGLTFSFRGTWLDSEVTAWDSADPDEAAARVGNELPGTPELTLFGALDWQRPLGEQLLQARLWANYADGAFRDIENTAALLSDDFTTINARLGLVFADRWSVYLFGQNLADEEYVTSRRILVGMLGEYYGPPRTYGIGLRYEVR